MRALVSELFRRNRPLAWAGLLNALAIPVCLVLWWIDDTQILGVNRWTKPLKFLLSVWTYLWTIAWILPSLRVPRWLSGIIAWLIALSLVIENSLIVMQATRGVRSHFNVSSPFDGAVFGMMGTLIAVNTVMIVVLTLLFFLRAEGATVWRWSIRLGLLLFIAGSVEGSYMIGQRAHTVGGPDGGPGLPFLGWSTIAGDLRPFHLLTLHGLQILPLFAWWLSQRDLSERQRLASLSVAAAAYSFLSLGVLSIALRKIPILSF